MLIKFALPWNCWLHKQFHICLFPLQHLEILENIKRGMAPHAQLALPNEPNQGIWSYYELL